MPFVNENRNKTVIKGSKKGRFVSKFLENRLSFLLYTNNCSHHRDNQPEIALRSQAK